MPWTRRVAKIECDKYETKLTVPGHSFPRGAEIRVDGIPMLDGGSFFVEHSVRMGRSCFNLCRNVSVDVAEIDSANSVVRTKVPHQLGEKHSSLQLFAFDPVAKEQIMRSYSIREVIDEKSLRLQEYCDAKKIFLPAELGADWEQTRLQKDACEVVLPPACSSEIGPGAIAPLVLKPPPSPKSCMREWQQAVRAARSASKLTEAVPELGLPKSPDVSLLRVGSCGWDDCSGLFERTAHLDFQKNPGLVFIRYIEHLGWCLFADVQPLDPLWEERHYLNLAAGQAPQLLYIRQDPDVCGQWEPVIGPAPGPFVAVHREISVRSPGAQTGSQPSLLLMPGVSSTVLDVLCNYSSADWRGGMGHGMGSDSVWGQSPVQALLSAFKLFQDITSCSSVCRMWREALNPFADLQTLCYRALGLPDGSKVKLPSIQECVCSTVVAGMMWEDPISAAGHSIFRSNAWPALISGVEIASEMGEDEDHFLQGGVSQVLNKHAPTFQQVARQILREVPLAWKTKPRTLSIQHCGDYQLATCDLLGFSADTRKQSCVCLAQEGELLALDGSRLLPPSATALSPLEVKGLRLLSSSFGKSSSMREAKAPGARCGTVYCSIPKEETGQEQILKEAEGCPFCAKYVNGQVGSSQFSGYFQMLFSTSDSKLISFKITFNFPTCFATSEGPEIISELQKLVPWCMDAVDDWDNEDDGSFFGEDVDDDEDPGENDDQTDSEEEEMEDGEEEEEVNGIQE
eukprot:s332_g16.t1